MSPSDHIFMAAVVVAFICVGYGVLDNASTALERWLRRRAHDKREAAMTPEERAERDAYNREANARLEEALRRYHRTYGSED